MKNEANDIKILEEQIINNEVERISDNKLMYLHYIHSQMAYHCSAMQTLTKLFTTINASDPKEDLGVFFY